MKGVPKIDGSLRSRGRPSSDTNRMEEVKGEAWIELLTVGVWIRNWRWDHSIRKTMFEIIQWLCAREEHEARLICICLLRRFCLYKSRPVLLCIRNSLHSIIGPLPETDLRCRLLRMKMADKGGQLDKQTDCSVEWNCLNWIHIRIITGNYFSLDGTSFEPSHLNAKLNWT